MRKILLASKSPRRQELLKMLDYPFEVVSGIEVEESYPEDLRLEEVPAYLSKLKSDGYSILLKNDDILVTADTVVILDNEILGKPKDLEDAGKMLRKLSGKTHQVITGVTILSKEKSLTFSARTDVEFASLIEDEIEYYVEKYRPLDKAGAYGIQEWIGAVGVKGIIGSFYNVMGLPVHRLSVELKKFM